MNTDYAVRTHGLTKFYGQKPAVDHIDMNVKKGEIMNYTLYMNLAECPLGYDGLSTLRPVIVGAVFCIIYAAAGKVILSKKDI